MNDLIFIQIPEKRMLKPGDYLVVIDRTRFVTIPARGLMQAVERGVSFIDRLQDDGEPGEQPEVKTEMTGALLNRLDALVRLPDVRRRCRALYALIAREPGLKAADYTRLLRDHHPEFKLEAGSKGRQAAQRALKILTKIGAVDHDGGGHPAYRVI